MKKLSVLICSLESRKRFLDRLLERINPQTNNDQVEIIIDVDKGERTIGKKRNDLLHKAKGSYISFVDDDDLVAPDYVKRIIEATRTDPDCVGMEGIITFDGRNPKKFIHSLRYREWFEKKGIYYRNPNHLSPVKRELALQVMFPEINMGEDQDYSMRLLPFLKTEKYISGPIYFYEYISNKGGK